MCTRTHWVCIHRKNIYNSEKRKKKSEENSNLVIIFARKSEKKHGEKGNERQIAQIKKGKKSKKITTERNISIEYQERMAKRGEKCPAFDRQSKKRKNVIQLEQKSGC